MKNQEYYKRWKFDLINDTNINIFYHPTSFFEIIEGIGCIFPFSLLDPIATLIPIEYRCNFCGFYQNNKLLYGDCSLAVNEIKSSSNKNIFIENPCHEESFLTIKNASTKGKIRFFNAEGKTIYSTAIQGVQKLRIGDCINHEGLYYYSFIDDLNGKVETGRFLLQ